MTVLKGPGPPSGGYSKQSIQDKGLQHHHNKITKPVAGCTVAPQTWRRIGIRLSIGLLTGLRGALATMERKLHDIRFNELILSFVGKLWRWSATVARAPRSPVAFAGIMS